ncbi:uncharacterized protein LOC144439864 [Glandiceps talaboti]
MEIFGNTDILRNLHKDLHHESEPPILYNSIHYFAITSTESWLTQTEQLDRFALYCSSAIYKMMIRIVFLGVLCCAMAHADFTIVKGSFNMADAVAACKNAGLALAKITTGCEFNKMLDHINAEGLSSLPFWIDAKVGDGGFVESNKGKKLPYNNFVCGQPDGSGACVQLWAGQGLLMDDTPCSYGKNAVCQSE